MSQSLLQLCDTFYKTATGRDDELKSLLRDAILNMDNNYFQVFLDLLEEEYPEKRAWFNGDESSSGLYSKLDALNKLYPSLILRDHELFSGILPFNISFPYINKNGIQIKNKHYLIAMINDSIFLTFHNPIIVNDLRINSLNGKESYIRAGILTNQIALFNREYIELDQLDQQDFTKLCKIIIPLIDKFKADCQMLSRTLSV